MERLVEAGANSCPPAAPIDLQTTSRPNSAMRRKPIEHVVARLHLWIAAHQLKTPALDATWGCRGLHVACDTPVHSFGPLPPQAGRAAASIREFDIDLQA